MYSGAGNKQCGFGEGKKCPSGKYKFVEGDWVSVNQKYGVEVDSINKDTYKIGKEICLMTKHGEKHKHKELNNELTKLHAYKEDKELSEKIVTETLKGYYRDKRRERGR